MTNHNYFFCMPYSPEAIIGARHILESVPKTCEIIDQLIKDCRLKLLGIEPDTFPVNPLLHSDDFIAYFNAIGDYAKSRGVDLLCLSTPDVEERVARISHIRTSSEIGNATNQLLDATQLNPLEQDSPDARLISRMWYGGVNDWLIYTKVGHTPSLLRDITFVERAKEFEPQAILVGAGHIPPFFIEFPRSKIHTVLAKGL